MTFSFCLFRNALAKRIASSVDLHKREHNGFTSALFRHTARCHNESVFLLCFKMAVVHVSHMINAAPLVADNARDESIQQKVRSYPQRSNLLDDDFKYASSVSSGSSKLTPISFRTRLHCYNTYRHVWLFFLANYYCGGFWAKWRVAKCMILPFIFSALSRHTSSPKPSSITMNWVSSC